MTQALAFTLVLVLFTASAHAQLTPIAADRYVDSYGEAGNFETGGTVDSDNEVGTPFLPFVEAVSANVTDPNARGTGSANQNSTISAMEVLASGSCAANGESYDFDSYGQGTGESRFQLTFQLVGSTPYSISGTLENTDNGGVNVSLLQGSTVVHIFAPDFNSDITFNESGTLPAGQYVLTAHAGGGAYADPFFPFDYAFASYDLTFQVGTATATATPLDRGGLQLSASPNPFPARTTFHFGAEIPTQGSITIFDLRGRLVREWDHVVSSWDGRDAAGRRVHDGVYLVRLVTPNEARHTKVTLLR